LSLKYIINMFVKHGLLSQDKIPYNKLQKLVDEDMEQDEIFFAILEEIAPERSFLYSLASGGWVDGNLIGEFYSNVETIVEMSQGDITIEDLKLSPPINSSGKEDEDMEMSISFTYNKKKYLWVFSRNINDNFIEGFTTWANLALKNNYLYLGDGPVGFHLPKELIKDLKKIGIENEVNDVRGTGNTRYRPSKKEVEDLYNSITPELEEGRIPWKQSFIKLKKFAEYYEYSIPPILERKGEACRFIAVKTTEAKVIAYTFIFFSEIPAYINKNYSDLCDPSKNMLNIIIYDTLSNSILKTDKDGIWTTKKFNL
jgi:hypothetical protein